MGKYESGLSNLSYTNKDFNSIYNELLDLADRISPKWKPSQSNESDPGVLLLKLDAIIGDKNNYNIDKNILELFPSSVTQYPAAREIFEQCGYIMPYYRAANVIVSINMRSEPQDVTNENDKSITRLYTLPDFTQVTNSDNSITYVIIDSNPYITSDGSTYQYTALEGTIKDYMLNNDKKITYDSLDYNNRLYFTDSNVAENGIFIQNIKNGSGKRNYSDWKKVDNIMTEPQNTFCYKFGVSKDGSRCYIEFPKDIANLIGEGIEIKYITTSGYAGNISSNTLTGFFSDVTSYVSNAADTRNVPENRVTDTTTSYKLTNDNVYIRNIKHSLDGSDPETIEEARKNYERTKNTFETLVSLRDYNNFLLTSKEVSNGFICDRSNDIQATTKIVTTDGKMETIHTQVRNESIAYSGTYEDENSNPVNGTIYKDEPELTAFDLKIYALKYVNPVTSDTRFDLSFELATSGYLTNLKDDMEDIKSIQHDFAELKLNDIIYIQLRYPINAKIIPYNKLQALEQLDIQAKIAKALYETLNSGELNFGEEIDYDKVYDVISESDERIKSLILDDFDYEAYVIYKDGDGKEIATKLPESFDEIEITDTTDSDDEIEITNTTDSDDEWDTSGTTKEQIACWTNTIRAKAILAGVTPLLKTPDYNYNFNFAVNHSDGEIKKEIGKVTTNSEITITLDTEGKGSIKLKPNESIYLTAPNYITKETYGNYVKYAYNLGTSIPANGIHELGVDESGADEYIVFYWKDSNDATEYKYAKYTKDSEYKYICPSIHLSSGKNSNKLDEGFDTAFDGIASGLNKGVDVLDSTNEYIINEVSYSASGVIAKCDNGTILSGAQSISIKDANTIALGKDSKDALYKAYWVLNSTKEYNNKTYYILFEKDAPEYTLKTGEYLFYSDNASKIFAMLGAGTKLTRDIAWLDEIEVEARSYEEVIYGVNNLLDEEDLWYRIPENRTITATEMMFYNIGAEATIKFTRNNNENTATALKIDNSKITFVGSDSSTHTPSLNDFTISYNYEGTEIKLPTLTISDAKWTGYSILNLDCGPNKEQILYGSDGRKQSITGTYKIALNSNNKYEFLKIPENTIKIEANEEDKRIQSNYAIQCLGGKDIDITAYDMTGARYNNSFYCYTTGKNVNVDNFNVDVDIDLAGSQGSALVNVNFIAPAASSSSSKYYLVPMLTNKDYEDLTIYETTQESLSNTPYVLTSGTSYWLSGNFFSNDDHSKAIDSDLVKYDQATNIYWKDEDLASNKIYKLTNSLLTINGADLKTKGLKFFAFKINSENKSKTLTVVAKNKSTDTTESTTITFLPAIEYVNENELNLTGASGSSNPEWNLFEIIKELDIEKKFNYTHKVDNDVYIENPLAPDSFLDPNHPYNQATICRWDYKNSNIKITNKIK